MKKNSKRLLSALLSLLMLFCAVTPAFAADGWNNNGSQIPIVHIFGDGTALYDKDGNKLLEYRELLGTVGKDNGTDSEKTEEEKEREKELYKSVANVVLPFLIEGLGTGNYDNYYSALQKEIGELFSGILLDKNGNNSNGSGISQENKNTMEYWLTHDQKKGKGYYGLFDYIFWYDWRLDPLETAEELHTFIAGIKESTGAKKVSIAARCLGSSVATAYVAKYGTEDIHAIAFNGGVVNGAEILSETISGKFCLDGNAVNRFLIDCNGYGLFNVDTFINETIDMLSKAGVFEVISGVTKETIYYTVVKGVTSALALSTFFTFPSYWAAVKSEDYETAKEYVFGKEGSEKRREYAGLIAKLDNYDKKVRQKIPEIMNEINDSGNLAVIAKYGSQIVPVIESRNELADQFATVKSASYGATTSDIYSTLSDDYITQRISEGKGKYISPDKQIDASTCLFPNQTWFVKGVKHSNWTNTENDIIYAILKAENQLTVEDSPLSQFIVYDNETKKGAAMTQENCNTYFWTANEKADKPESPAARLMFFLFSFLKWLKSAFERLSSSASKK